MPQQLDSIVWTVEARHGSEHRLDRAHGAEGLLVAMAVQMRRAPALVGERQGHAAGGEIGRERLLEQEGGRRQRLDLRLRQQRGELVAEGEEAGRLEPDDPRAPRHEGRERVERAAGLPPRLVDQARREVGAAAAERAAAAARLDPVQPVAGGREHPLGRLQVLALVVRG